MPGVASTSGTSTATSMAHGLFAGHAPTTGTSTATSTATVIAPSGQLFTLEPTSAEGSSTATGTAEGGTKVVLASIAGSSTARATVWQLVVTLVTISGRATGNSVASGVTLGGTVVNVVKAYGHSYDMCSIQAAASQTAHVSAITCGRGYAQLLAGFEVDASADTSGSSGASLDLATRVQATCDDTISEATGTISMMFDAVAEADGDSDAEADTCGVFLAHVRETGTSAAVGLAAGPVWASAYSHSYSTARATAQPKTIDATATTGGTSTAFYMQHPVVFTDESLVGTSETSAQAAASMAVRNAISINKAFGVGTANYFVVAAGATGGAALARAA